MDLSQLKKGLGRKVKDAFERTLEIGQFLQPLKNYKCGTGEPAVNSHAQGSGSEEDFSESEDEGLSGYKRGTFTLQFCSFFLSNNVISDGF